MWYSLSALYSKSISCILPNTVYAYIFFQSFFVHLSKLKNPWKYQWKNLNVTAKQSWWLFSWKNIFYVICSWWKSPQRSVLQTLGWTARHVNLANSSMKAGKISDWFSCEVNSVLRNIFKKNKNGLLRNGICAVVINFTFFTSKQLQTWSLRWIKTT